MLRPLSNDIYNLRDEEEKSRWIGIDKAITLNPCAGWMLRSNLAKDRDLGDVRQLEAM